MKLETLIRVLRPLAVQGDLQRDIESLAYDSRQVRPGALFVALPGQRCDGCDFIQDALRRGAVAVVGESVPAAGSTPLIRVADARRALAELACAFYGSASSKLFLVGVTGTNGKSTVAFMIRDLLRAAGLTPGLIGTIRYEIGERSIPAGRTTPEAPDLQAMLDQMHRAGCRSAVMEVSSHGLDQKRVWGIDFDVGVFTNLTQDHLDYHQTMQRYYAAKAELFKELGQAEKRADAVINLDDPWGMHLTQSGVIRVALTTFGLHPQAQVRAENLTLNQAGSSFEAVTPWGSARMKLALLGRFNVSNALAATAVGGLVGLAPRQIAEVLAELSVVPGRLERIPNDRDVNVFVDYAHTPDALSNTLRTLREFTPGRLILVFGCGGNRDRGKRPLMGAVAAALADITILTSDNPRQEDPAQILAEITPGFGDIGRYEIEDNREEAIRKALSRARAFDTVLIAGKGHETFQEIGNTSLPFDDRDVVRRLLNEK